MKRNTVSHLLFLALFLNCMSFCVSSSFSSEVEKASIINAKSVNNISKTKKIIEKITVKDAITYTLISATLIACIMQHQRFSALEKNISQRFSVFEGRVYELEEEKLQSKFGSPPPYEPSSSINE